MKHTSRHSATCVTLAILVCGCASVAAEKQYIAPSDQTIDTETQQSHDDRPSHIIYVVNRSTVPITVFGTRLSGCENVKQQCTPRNVSIRVGPQSRTLVTRVEADNPNRAWTYNFGFSWRPDSSTDRAIASALGATRELSRQDFSTMRDRIARIRVEPDSLTLTPGQEVRLAQFQVLVVDKDGKDLGSTHWMSYRTSASPAVHATMSGTLVAKGLGRAAVHYSLAAEAQALLPNPVAEVEVPIIVAFPLDPHAPRFSGTAVDADTQKPLACAGVALEDSAKNEVSRSRTNNAGMFELRSPRSGTYRVRFDLDGWSPFYGPTEVAAPDETKQTQYPVKFTEQLMGYRSVSWAGTESEAARLSGAVAPLPAPGAPPGQVMRLGGTSTLPNVEIVSRAMVGPMWLQFAVNDTGRVDSASVVIPAATVPAARAAIFRALPQLRYAAAKENGKATCDLVRLRVLFTAR